MLRKITLPLALLGFFATVGILLWEWSGKSFYLLNFGYIGASLCVSTALLNSLPRARKTYARNASMLLIGGYMLGYLGLYLGENMQIEGFFEAIFAGAFEGAAIHYLIAKIIVPLIWGRAWCGWACWTAAILDLLPWKRPTARIRRLGVLRYIHLLLALGLTFWIMQTDNPLQHIPATTLLVAGNALYFGTGLLLAWQFEDNRAFCKYLCPVVATLKLSRFSLSKISVDTEQCSGCGHCEQACPMGIRLLEYARNGQRILSTECIYCHTCAFECPNGAIASSKGFDAGFRENLNFK